MSYQSKEVRLDEVLLKKVDDSGLYVQYVGRADGMDATDTDARWQIARITTLLGVETTEYATYGSYKNKWSDRFSYFDDFAAEAGIIYETIVPGLTVTVVIYHQMTVYGYLFLDGTMRVDGTLILEL